MASTFTPALALEIPAHGDYASTGWDNPMDNSLRSLDAAYGGMLTLTVSGGTTVLTTAQASNPVIYVNGTLGSNQIIAFPSTIAGRRIIIPACTLGNFALFVVGGGGADANGIYFWTQFAIPYGIVITPSRVYWDYGNCDPGIVVDRPSGWPGNGWLPCDGRYVSQTRHDLLYGVIGGTYGISGSTFKLPDFRGTVLAMADQIGAVPGTGPFSFNAGNRGILNSWGMNTFAGQSAHVLSTAEVPYHDHSYSQTPHNHPDPGHAHGGVLGEGSGWYSLGQYPPIIQAVNTAVAATGIQAANANINFVGVGGGGAHNNIQPTTTTMKMIKW